MVAINSFSGNPDGVNTLGEFTAKQYLLDFTTENFSGVDIVEADGKPMVYLA